MNTLLKRPTRLSFILGYVVSKTVYMLFPKQFTIPTRVGTYTLESEIIKNNPYKEYSVGIFTRGTERFFVKTWHGSLKDYSYYSLVNEGLITSILVTKTEENSELKFPSLIDVIETPHSLSLVYEFIEGDLLRTFPSETQEKVIAAVLQDLDYLSSRLTSHDRSVFPLYSRLHYFMLIPVFCVLAALRKFSELSMVLRVTFKSVSSLLSLKSEPLTLAHRDITSDNIMVVGNRYYLLDLEQMIITYSNYDRESLMVEPRSYAMGLRLKDVFHLKHSFLTYYVPLHMLALEEDYSLIQHYAHYLGGIC